MAKWLSENPAKLPGLENSKGKIAIGYDADLIVWNDEKQFTVLEKIIQHRTKITPYLNKTLSGIVEQTYLAGVEVFKEGKFSALNTGKIIYKN